MSKKLQGDGSVEKPFLVSDEDYQFIRYCRYPAEVFEKFPQFRTVTDWPPSEKFHLRIDPTLDNKCICEGTGIISGGTGKPDVACTCRRPANRQSEVMHSIKAFAKLVERYEQGEQAAPWAVVRAELRELVDEINRL